MPTAQPLFCKRCRANRLCKLTDNALNAQIKHVKTLVSKCEKELSGSCLPRRAHLFGVLHCKAVYGAVLADYDTRVDTDDVVTGEGVGDTA